MIELFYNDMQKSLQTIQKYIPKLTPEESFKVSFICEEILTNIIRHGDFGDKEPSISFCFDKKEFIELTFIDNAKKFNMLAYPDPDISVDLSNRSLGGLGIYLTKKYAQDIVYKYANGLNVLKVYV